MHWRGPPPITRRPPGASAREIYNTYMDILRLYLRNIQVVAKYKSEIIRNANALIMFLYSTSKPPPAGAFN